MEARGHAGDLGVGGESAEAEAEGGAVARMPERFEARLQRLHLAVELAVKLTSSQGNTSVTHVLAALFFIVSFTFVYRSFYAMRIRSDAH